MLNNAECRRCGADTTGRLQWGTRIVPCCEECRTAVNAAVAAMLPGLEPVKKEGEKKD